MSQYQFQAPPLTKINKSILIASGALFLLGTILNAVGGIKLIQWVGLSGSMVSSGMIFQLITYPFIETQLLGFLFNGLVVWFIGSELEKNWGSKIYLRFILICIIGVGLFHSLTSIMLLNGTSAFYAPLYGLSGINMAFLVSYAMLYPDRQMSMMMIFPMKAKTFCWILIGIEIYMAVFSNLASAWSHLMAMVLAFCVIKYQGRPLIKSMLQGKSGGASRKKSHLHVVKDNDQDPPKYWQ